MQFLSYVLSFAAGATTTNEPNGNTTTTTDSPPSWITPVVRDLYCRVSTGWESACIEDQCQKLSTDPNNVNCSDSTIADSADLHTRIRAELEVIAGAPLADDGRYEFSQQLSIENYVAYMGYTNDPDRPIRIPGWKGITAGFTNPQKAYLLLIELFLNVPGSNWIVSDYEPLELRNAQTAHAENLVFAAIRDDSPSGAAPSGDDPVTTPYQDKLQALLAYSSARQLVRFSDSDHVIYAGVLRDAVAEFGVRFDSGLTIPADVMQWVYDLVTKSCLLLRPPAERRAIMLRTKTANAAIPAAFPDGLLTDQILAITPFVDWEADITSAEMQAMVTAFYQQPMELFPDSQRAMGIWIFADLALSLGIDDGSWQYIQKWWPIVGRFMAQPWHFLDVLHLVLRVLASGGANTFPHVVTCVKSMRALLIEEREMYYAADRSTGLETRQIVSHPIDVDIVQNAFSEKQLNLTNISDGCPPSLWGKVAFAWFEEMAVAFDPPTA